MTRGSNAIPTCDERTSTGRAAGSTHARQSTMPSRREKIAVKSMPSGSGARAWSKLSWAQLAGDAVLGHQAAHPGAVEPHEQVDAAGQRDVVGSRREHRAAHRDDARDEVGPPGGDAAGQHPAEAVAHDAHARPASLRDLLQPLLELCGGGQRAAHVGADVRAVGPEALVAQRPAHRPQRRVTGEESRHQQHRLTHPHRARAQRRTTSRAARAEGRHGVAAGLGEGRPFAQHRHHGGL